jgi:hypothetical protein
MAVVRPFAYNTGSTISGTDQIGDLAIGVTEQTWSLNIGGVKWWNGPDECPGYIIAHPTPSGNQPNPDNISAYLGFWRSETRTELSFVELTNSLFNTNFTNGEDCKTYLNSNGYWTSFGNSYPECSPTPSQTPTQTPTNTPTPTQTPTNTPTQTQTPTPTPSGIPSSAVTFSRTFTSGLAPGSTIETAWTTFRGQLTGTYTKFDFTSSNGQGYTGITDAVKVQQLANALRTGTTGVNLAVTISGVTWNVGCCACRNGGALNGAVEFANVALCSGSSTAALRPWINNSNWGGIGSTVGAATQTLTLKFY